MKFRCSKSNLLTGVQIVSKAVPSKTTMSIMECILIRADKDCLTLTANDMELGIETVIEGDILENGMIALDAKIFLENFIMFCLQILISYLSLNKCALHQ